MLPTPLWLIGILLLIGPIVGGVMYVKGVHDSQVAYSRGIHEGKAIAAAEGLAEVQATEAALRDATTGTPLPANQAAIIALCKKSYGCRERGTIK